MVNMAKSSWCKRIAVWLSAIMMITGLTPGYAMAAEPVNTDISDSALPADETLYAENAEEAELSDATEGISTEAFLDTPEEESFEETAKPEEDDASAAVSAKPEEGYDDTASVSADTAEEGTVTAEEAKADAGTLTENTREEAEEQEDDLFDDKEGSAKNGVIEHEEKVTEYVVSYIIEYNGKQVTNVVTRKEDEVPFKYPPAGEEGDVTYEVDYDSAFFTSSRVTGLFKGTEKPEREIISYTLVMKGEYRDGSRAEDEEGNEIEDHSVTLSANQFEENGFTVLKKYNHVYVYANVGAYATDTSELEGVVISTPSTVTYTGLRHRLKASTDARKKRANRDFSFDIDLKLTDYKTGDTEGYELVYGKDYYAEYKNSRKASVKFVGNYPESRDYVKLYGSHQAALYWPQILIKGKGNYKGLSCVVYYDILPVSISEGGGTAGPFADCTKESYVLNKKGRLVIIPKPSRYVKKYNKAFDEYVTDYNKKTRYTLGRDVDVELEKYSETENNWERLGDLTGKNTRKQTLSTVTGGGRYRVKIVGKGNYYGSLYDTFSVYAPRKVLFSSLKLNTAKVTYKAEGVSANLIFKGFKGKNYGLTPEMCNIRLVAVSPEARVDAGFSRAMSAGTYRLIVGVNDLGRQTLSNSNLAFDGETNALVTIKSAKLKASMFKSDWKPEGEPFNAVNKDIRLSFNGISAEDITIGKTAYENGKSVIRPVNDSERADYIKEVSSNYITLDGEKLNNMTPGTHRLYLYGRKGYADSVVTFKFKRIPAVISRESVSVSSASYNAAGLRPVVSIDEITVDDLIVTYGDEKEYDVTLYGVGNPQYKLTYDAKKASRGRAQVKITVLDSSTGFKKGSSVTVGFPVNRSMVSGAPIRDYREFIKGQEGGAFYVKTSSAIQAGKKSPAFTLYQADEDGRRLAKVDSKLYKGTYAAGEKEGTFDLVISNKGGAYDFGPEGLKYSGAYITYKTMVKKWSSMGDLKVSDRAVVIKNRGDGRVYTSDDIKESMPAVPVIRGNKGSISVRYTGGSYVLPVVEQLSANNVALKLSEGDYKISYKKNDRKGTASMTITLTYSGIQKTNGAGGSKTYTFRIKPQSNTKLIL